MKPALISRAHLLALTTATISLVVGFQTTAAQTTAVWQGGPGAWNDATKWSTNPLYPNSASYDVEIATSAHITVNADTQIGSLFHTDGTLAGTHDLTAFNISTLGNVVHIGSGTTSFMAPLNIVDNVAVFSGRTIKSSGATFWSQGNIVLDTDSSWQNHGTLRARSDGIFGFNSSDSFFENHGTLIRDGVAAVSTFGSDLPFHNRGEVSVQAQTLQLLGGGTSDGNFHVASGAALVLAGGHDFEIGTFSGPGAVRFAATNQTNSFDATSTYSVQHTVLQDQSHVSFNNDATTTTLTMTGGTMVGSGTMTTNGSSVLTGGLIMGSGTLTFVGPLSLEGNIGLFAGRTVHSASTTEWTQGNVTLNSATWNHSGTLLLRSAGTFGQNSSDSTFHNTGTVIADQASGLTRYGSGIAFENQGLVEVQAGVLIIPNFEQAAGTLSLRGGNFTSNNFQIQSGAIVGAGTMNADVHLLGGTISPGHADQEAADLLHIAGNLVWDAAGSIVFDLGSNGNSTDSIQIDGTLNRTGVSGWTFEFQDNGWQVGETYSLLSFASTDFQAEDFVVGNGGGFTGTFNIVDGTSLEFTLQSSGGTSLAGDFDGDGQVDGVDFLTWQRNPSIGPLAAWEAEFGGSAMLASVPEPSSIFLIITAIVAVRWRHHRPQKTSCSLGNAAG